MRSLVPVALWVVLISVILLIPMDPGFQIGDFEPTAYTGKLNPLEDDSIQVEDIFFSSHGENCHAWLYTKQTGTATTNEDEEQTGNPIVLPPVVLMAHGFGTQKDIGLDRYATKFVQEGFAVFMFDYRNFGASSGRPRNLVSPKRHLEDYHAALDFLESSPTLKQKINTSKIALWGTSFSGGHVLEIASRRAYDNNIIGVVAQTPHLSGRAAAMKSIKKRGLAKMARLALAAVQDVARDFVGLPPVVSKLIGTHSSLAMMAVDPADLTRYLERQPEQRLGGWINQIPARALLQVRFYNPIDTLAIKEIKVPVMMVGASLDELCPPDLIKEASSMIPGSKLILREGSHFQIYDPENSKVVADEMVKFYKSCLA